jgi:hypothetical protein
MLRRLHDVGPIGFEAHQAWFLAATMVEAAAVHPQLRDVMPALWDVVMRDFVSEGDALEQFPLLGFDGVTPEEYDSLAAAVTSMLHLQRLPNLLPRYVLVEFDKALQTIVGKTSGNE